MNFSQIAFPTGPAKQETSVPIKSIINDDSFALFLQRYHDENPGLDIGNLMVNLHNPEYKLTNHDVDKLEIARDSYMEKKNVVEHVKGEITKELVAEIAPSDPSLGKLVSVMGAADVLIAIKAGFEGAVFSENKNPEDLSSTIADYKNAVQRQQELDQEIAQVIKTSGVKLADLVETKGDRDKIYGLVAAAAKIVEPSPDDMNEAVSMRKKYKWFGKQLKFLGKWLHDGQTYAEVEKNEKQKTKEFTAKNDAYTVAIDKANKISDSLTDLYSQIESVSENVASTKVLFAKALGTFTTESKTIMELVRSSMSGVASPNMAEKLTTPDEVKKQMGEYQAKLWTAYKSEIKFDTMPESEKDAAREEFIRKYKAGEFKQKTETDAFEQYKTTNPYINAHYDVYAPGYTYDSLAATPGLLHPDTVAHMDQYRDDFKKKYDAGEFVPYAKQAPMPNKQKGFWSLLGNALLEIFLKPQDLK